MTARWSIPRILAIPATPVLASAAAARVLHGVQYHASGVVFDMLFLLPVAWFAVRAAGRRASWGLCIAMSLVFVLGHATKIAYLGLPIVLSDLGPALRLLRMQAIGSIVLAVAAFAVATCAFAWAFRPRSGRWPWLLALVAYAALLPMLATFVRASSDRPGAHSHPAAVLQRAGGIAYALADAARVERANSRAAVARALHGRFGRPFAAPGFHRRNVHVVLMEALWDPLRLTGYRFSRDPWDPGFRRLWEAGGRSGVLVPVFGGATANSEFEALCGLPAHPERVLFEDDLRNPVPCLPRVLREAGYATTAHHPYHTGFWSRDTAYASLGFARYHASASYRMHDLDGQFLADASTFAQTRAAYDAAGEPQFVYIVSLSSHFPYERDRARRPDVLTVAPAAAKVSDYANAVAYSTAALMEYVASVQASDPDAVIVAFGDHAPMLGAAVDQEVAGSALRPRLSNGDTDWVGLSTTPLLVIDGRKGPVPMGTLPLYGLPTRVLGLLGSGAPQLPHAAVGANARHRMFLGRLLSGSPSGWRACVDDNAACRNAMRERDDGHLVREDLLHGPQHTLRLSRATALGRPVSMAVDPEPCVLEVTAWGPRGAATHQPFNPQANGRSAIWLHIREANGNVELLVGDEASPVTVNGTRASASFATPRFLAAPGRYPVAYRCGSAPAVALGTFTVA